MLALSLFVCLCSCIPCLMSFAPIATGPRLPGDHLVPPRLPRTEDFNCTCASSCTCLLNLCRRVLAYTTPPHPRKTIREDLLAKPRAPTQNGELLVRLIGEAFNSKFQEPSSGTGPCLETVAEKKTQAPKSVTNVNAPGPFPKAFAPNDSRSADAQNPMAQ